jgi:hypothetical protein
LWHPGRGGQEDEIMAHDEGHRLSDWVWMFWMHPGCFVEQCESVEACWHCLSWAGIAVSRGFGLWHPGCSGWEKEIGTPVGRHWLSVNVLAASLVVCWTMWECGGILALPWISLNGSFKEIQVVTPCLPWVRKGDWNTCWRALTEWLSLCVLDACLQVCLTRWEWCWDWIRSCMVRSWSCNVVKQQLSEEQFEWNFFWDGVFTWKNFRRKIFLRNYFHWKSSDWKKSVRTLQDSLKKSSNGTFLDEIFLMENVPMENSSCCLPRKKFRWKINCRK